MSSPESAGGEMMNGLKVYAEFLKERNAALLQLATSSREMRSVLQHDSTSDIGDLLARREQQCRSYGELCARNQANNDLMISRAQAAARSGEPESSTVAMTVLALHEDAQDMAEEIMTCQSECEAIMRTRLESLGQALKHSKQRRKLNSVYGPAHRHDVPVFMDHRR